MGNLWGLGIHAIFLTLFSVATVYTCSGAPNITMGCSEQDGLALLNLKRSLKDDFRMLSSWVGTDCCRWEGVICDAVTGNVVGLHLRGTAGGSFSCSTGTYGWASAQAYSDDEEYYYLVSEEVNSSLAELRHLKYLDLSGNDFQGSRIPNFIGSLKQLRYLNLSNAGFSGAIPHQIGNLTGLKVLDLNSLSYSQELMANDMSWISSLSSLEYLDLNGVDLSGAQNRDMFMVLTMIPPLMDVSLSCCGFTNADLAGLHLNLSRPLSKIKRLDLSWNAFEGRFPPVLTNMSSLLVLDLSGNTLNSSIPIMPSLLKLDLSYNNIAQIEHIGIWRQCYLTELFVSSNHLGEEAVDPSRNTSECSDYALETLDLSENGLNGFIPEYLGKLTRLRVLHLEFNQMKSPIPETLGRLGLLEELYLSHNQLNSSIPESIGRLAALTDLNLESNLLTGPIPSSLGRLASLQTFSVSSNFLNSTIPVTIGQPSKLVYLDVSNNSLEGVVSEAHFAKHSMLKYLDMSSNLNLAFNVSREWIPPFNLNNIRLGSCKISDEFPHWLQTQKNLDELVLSNASISGPLPTWLQHMPIIRILDLSHNKLNGPLARFPSRAPFHGLEEDYALSLYLQDNLFNGSIPRSLCTMTGLRFLDLSGNRLTGKIPDCLENLQNLKTMILGSNGLSGVIPSSLGRISPLLSWLNLNDNNLVGELPQDLGKLQALRVLDLGDNKFSGMIPEWIGRNLSSLIALRLNKNNFTGKIPYSLCNNSNLQILDIANNNITGPIPRCFGELNGMVEVGERHTDNGSFDSHKNAIRQVMQGDDLEYTKTLDFVFNMDLSSNKLTGEIPEELTALSLLLGLNLSHNHLNGRIPDKIGNMRSLISIDFSGNHLTGMIPPSMAALNFLSHLNLSDNNLFGQIPTGNQLQTLTDPSIYAGNRDLCGGPLQKKCSNHEDPTTRSKEKYGEGDEPMNIWFYLDIICGFGTGFWGVIGVLLFKNQWRKKLFTFAEVTMDKIHVAVAIKVTKMKRGKEAT